MRLAASFARRLAASLALVGGFAAVATGQFDVHGKWAGPWDWTELVGGAPNCNNALDEFSHASVLPVGTHAGKVLLWRYDVDPATCVATVTTESWLFDASAPQNLIRIFHQPLQSEIFCSGQAWDSNGNLVVAGGVSSSTSGVPRASYRFLPRQLTLVEYNELTGLPSISAPNCWVQLTGNLNLARYYPTVLQLNDNPLSGGGACTPSTSGSMQMVLGGPQSVNGGCGQPAQGNEVWALLEVGGDAWSCPIVSDRMACGSFNWPENCGNWSTTQAYDMLPNNPPPTFDLLDSYPRSFQLSNQQVFIAADVDTSACPPPAGNVPATSWVIDPPLNVGDAWKLRDGPNDVDDRYYGAAVLLHQQSPSPLDRVLAFGGADPPGAAAHDTVREFDFGALAQNGAWQLKAALEEPRVHCSAVALPTGEVLVLNGSRTLYFAGGVDPVFEPELYDPGVIPTDAGSSRLLAASNTAPAVNPVFSDNSTPRDYHAFAVLLPDGRVFVGGGESDAPNSDEYPQSAWTGEVFSPPYLFVGNQQAVRPVIESMPTRVDYWAQFEVEVTIQTGGQIDRVVAIRPAALTHHADVNQRYIELAFDDSNLTGTTGTLDVTAPARELAPKGHYMLFVVEQRTTGHRVPSVATFVKFK